MILRIVIGVENLAILNVSIKVLDIKVLEVKDSFIIE